MNKNSYSFDLETFRDMFQIFPKVPGQKFVDPPFEEEILTFMSDLGYPGNIKNLSKVKVEILPQPWRIFGTIINKCLSGKVTGLDLIRLSRAQIIWGMYHQKNVDYVYLSWEDLVYQIENKDKTEQAPKASSGKRIKYVAKLTRSGKKKQIAKGLDTLCEIALFEAEQMKLAIERSKTQLHSSQPSGSCAYEGTGVTPRVPDVPTYESDDEKISWKSSDEEDDDDETNVSKDEDDDDETNVSKDEDDDDQDNDDDERTDSDNDGDDFVHPKFSTHDEEDKEDDSFDPRVQTPSHVKTNDDEDNDKEIQDVNVEGDELDEEETNEEDGGDELYGDEIYKDTNINLEGRDIDMTDAYPDTGIDFIFNLNTEAISLIDVPVTTIVEPPFLSATTLPPPPTTLITHLQQTPVPTPATFAEAVSSIHGIVDSYLANKMNEAIKIAVRLQSDRLRDEAQAKNKDFINKLDANIKKIIKDQVKEQVKAQVSKILPKIKKTVNEQLEAEILTPLSNESKTSHVVATNLYELKLKKILIDKMESNKSIYRSDEQKNLYKALVEAYKSDKLILDTYGDTVTLKRCRDDEDKDEEPFAGSNRGSKRRRAGKEPESTKEPMHTAKYLEEPAHQEFETGGTKNQPDEETAQLPDWFQKPAKPPSPDRDWNKTLPNAHGPVQHWISSLAQMGDPCESFNELMDTPLDFIVFVMNRLKVDTLTLELLAGPTFELMKGSCKSLIELEYFLEEFYKVTADQLDWNNPEGQQYPHDLRKPLPLIPTSRGRQVIPFAHFINNDLEYLSGDSQVPVSYDKYALWEISHWGRKRQQFYGFAANRESARDVYSKRRIISVTKLQIIEWHNYKHLDRITVRRDDDKLYTFKEGDFNRLRIQDIEDMLLLFVQGKLTNLTVEERLAFNVSLRMFTRSIVIQRRVEDLQLGIESNQKKLNLTKPDTYRSDLKRREAYTAYSIPRGFIYHNKDKKHRLMCIDELHKFSNGTLNDVRTALDDRLKGIRMKYCLRLSGDKVIEIK
uniref:Uncharacterized protein n=1 Tax=Tanacetum cinerariifolium TaxID=118510 RepID=A0A6L2J050_TANCI|nr:hypothetical protein [Tanacetum cinerariifolium]